MRVFWIGLAAVTLALAGSTASAQMVVGGRGVYVSDFDGPYAAMPPGPPAYGYGPRLLPAREVYTVLREGGFAPLSGPQLRGNIYSIAVVNRRGEDGRLLIDARDGRIVRFMPAYAEAPGSRAAPPYGPQTSLPPPTVRGAPRPPASVPRVASRTAPTPKAAPGQAQPDVAAQPAPQQSASVQPQVQAQAAPTAPASSAVVQAKPAPAILPTQDMPAAQGLD